MSGFNINELYKKYGINTANAGPITTSQPPIPGGVVRPQPAGRAPYAPPAMTTSYAVPPTQLYKPY